MDMKDNPTNRKKVTGAIGKVAKELMGFMISDESVVEIPLNACNDFQDMLERMHDDAVRYACTSYPAEPRGNCKDCEYFPFCTADIVKNEEEDEE